MSGDARTTPRQAEIEPEAIVDFLAETALFAGCERQTIEKIAPHVFPADVPAGMAIIRAGTANPGIGFLYSGHATVRGPDGYSVVEQLEAGSSFGETGAFLGTSQTHSVIAEEPCVVLLLGHALVAEIATKVAPFSFAAARRLAARVPLAPPPQRGRPESGQRLGPDVIRFVRVTSYELTPQLMGMVPAQLIHQHRLLPLEVRGRTLTIGMVDPMSTATRTELQRLLPTVDVAIVAISQDDFNEVYVRMRLDSSRPRTGAHRHVGDSVPVESLVFDVADQEREAKQANVIGDEIVNLATKIVIHAIERGASDVHIDNDVHGPRVRFRVQGALYDWETVVPAPYAKGLAARFKVLAGLDVTERRLPQDGRIGVRIGRREVDMRVSTIPTSRGEKLALRIFEAASMSRSLDTIFADPRLLEPLRAAIQRPYGAIVVAGPTGSGKTTTLYAAVSERRRTRPDTNILTVEDPIEYRLAGVTQVQVNHAVDLGFAKVLRAMLRQDPDAIMVGEVRDDDTAQAALEAAMTGHLLFTSLHANNAVGAIQRLENLGASRALIGQALALVVVQRLARRSCPQCTTGELPPQIMMDNLAAHGLVERGPPRPLPRGTGCVDCNHTGHAGRIAVVEMLALDDVLRMQVMAGASLADIERSGSERGVLVSFRQSAIYLMNRQAINPSEALLTLT